MDSIPIDLGQELLQTLESAADVMQGFNSMMLSLCESYDLACTKLWWLRCCCGRVRVGGRDLVAWEAAAAAGSGRSCCLGPASAPCRGGRGGA